MLLNALRLLLRCRCASAQGPYKQGPSEGEKHPFITAAYVLLLMYRMREYIQHKKEMCRVHTIILNTRQLAYGVVSNVGKIQLVHTITQPRTTKPYARYRVYSIGEKCPQCFSHFRTVLMYYYLPYRKFKLGSPQQSSLQSADCNLQSTVYSL